MIMSLQERILGLRKWFDHRDVYAQIEVTVPSDEWLSFQTSIMDEIGSHSVVSHCPDGDVFEIIGIKFVKGPERSCPTCRRPH